jgi:hypothetical protein
MIASLENKSYQKKLLLSMTYSLEYLKELLVDSLVISSVIP